ncbi:peroxisomal N(1)-acetyl-spermine/spermidine oxidase [Microcaecilia unicolor]|uniref:Peroxisomal N(1)-acetyl-spermine/spermidine oxidase-like n=1 Tax=Microcaecilia unicolor TaxID=1415580 RepID=A0A6P7YK48_9AMPH|nr:peroxisomal N(1)-acetyl-spermine/spermidine oxidase-like [Microcaecilia unicolor]XP_030065349.1 peroxisomal N(1)-acetyl-spermine/spermidine oxidase-like [Microcaecilia unicolor]
MASNFLSSEPQIVIIGAGFAGLAAASTLVKQGLKNVVILEAMDRAGGRVQTLRPFGTNVIEMGATWIHGQKDNPLYQLAKEEELLAEEGLHVVSCLPGAVTPQDYFFTEHSKLLSSDTVEKITGFFGNLMSKIYNQDFKPDCSSWSLGDYLDQEFVASGLSDVEDANIVFEWCKRAECTDEACNSMYEFSLSQLGLYTPLEGPFFNCLGKRGYQAVIDVLLRNLPVNVLKCKKTVKCIHWADSPGTSNKSISHPVRVICEDGEEFLADHVIITVSLGCLKERAQSMFEPSLPQGKLEAIVKLGFGTVSKIFLEFEERFWPEDCIGIQLLWEKGLENKDVYNAMKQNEGWKEEWFKKIGGFDMVAYHDNVLCGWITGEAAEFMETLPEKEIGEVCVRLLRTFTGWSVSSLRSVLKSTWYSNPYTRGSYTNVPVGVDSVKEQMALAEPLPSLAHQNKKMRPLQVLFAGEATHIHFYTTTHGAYLSGVREAERLLHHHGVSARL